MMDEYAKPAIAWRFRGFLPVVVDVETGGFDPQRHPLLEIAASIIRMDDKGLLIPAPPLSCHVLPFIGSEIDPRALAFNGIDPDHPFRDAVPEREALTRILTPVCKAAKASTWSRRKSYSAESSTGGGRWIRIARGRWPVPPIPELHVSGGNPSKLNGIDIERAGSSRKSYPQIGSGNF